MSAAASPIRLSGQARVLNEKPLVFISANQKDYAWRESLKAKLNNYSDIEWWDDSRIPTGTKWRDEIEVAINRACVAVVLISPAYLTSVTATSELIRLGQQAEGGNSLTLFPILLEKAAWQQYTAFRDVHIWAAARPIGHLNGEALDRELVAIAERVRDVARSQFDRRKLAESVSKKALEHVSIDPEPERRVNRREKLREFELSEATETILNRASLLAQQSGRPAITSSCLLFAFAEPSTAHSTTSRFVHDLLHRSSSYHSVFESFLQAGNHSLPIIADEPGLEFKLSLNAHSILLYADFILRRAGLTQQIHTRHLFGAILIAPQADRPQKARIRLNSMGFDLFRTRMEFFEFLRRKSTDNLEEWEFLLELKPHRGESDSPPNEPDQPNLAEEINYQRTYPAFVPDRAAYNRVADAPLDDSLGVTVHAGHLAQLIAAKHTFMPLSIGLFGSWGAGKSHFMDLLDEQLRMLVQQPGEVFYQQIVQIRFNAWHYLDTNLWANLVSEIFDQLFATLDEREDTTAQQVETLKKKLANQSVLAAEARAALATAENAREEAEEKLRSATQARKSEEYAVKNLLDDLANLAINSDVRAQLSAAADALGWPKLESSFAELETRAEEVRSLGGRTKALALSIFTGPRSWRRGLWLAAAVALPLVVTLMAAYGPQWMKDLLTGAGRTIAQVVLAIGALSTWLTAKIKASNTVVGRLEGAYDEIKTVRSQRETEDDATNAKKLLAAKKQAEEEARHTLHEAEEKMKLLRAELSEMAPGRQLIRFLKQRASAEDYRRHLGIVSLVRRDFEQLSNLLLQTRDADQNELPKIDRIVLYIDDLDRCKADRVIEVLEAVHLLLAFPLFAVIVAVDPRWLRQSLLDHYPRLVGVTRNVDSKQNERNVALAATPQDYLEKIFQVPFHLEAIEKPGFEALVKNLFPVEQPVSENGEDVAEELARTTEQMYRGVSTETAPMTEIAPPDITISAQAGTRQPESVDIEEKQPVSPDPQRLTLTRKEIEDVQRFQTLFETPRAVKRFANTYFLVRVGVSRHEWNEYLGVGNQSGSYRVPLLLLAVTSAFPALARPWLLWLKTTKVPEWQLSQQNAAVLADQCCDTVSKGDWERFANCLTRLRLDDWPRPDPSLLATWIPRVARYSF
jgi:hypothetical protein